MKTLALAAVAVIAWYLLPLAETFSDDKRLWWAFLPAGLYVLGMLVLIRE